MTYGDGNGYSYGYGTGYGDGYGDGNGDGDGYGDGNGDGNGDGYGDGGNGETIGRVADHPVRLLALWGYVVVGCQVHSIATWRERWREIAADEGVRVTEEEAATLLAIAETDMR